MSTKKYVPFSRPELITVRAYRKAQLSAQRDWLGMAGLGDRVARPGRAAPREASAGKAAGANFSVWRPRDWLDGAIERELRLLKGQPTLLLEAS